MRHVLTGFFLVLVLAGLAATQNPVLSVEGSGLPGTALTFTVKASSVPNQVAFLGVSPLPGKTDFGFLVMDLAWPIFASGMGSLNRGSVDHRIVVPASWPTFLTVPMYAQSVVVVPRGAGYQVVTTNVVKFLVRGQ